MTKESTQPKIHVMTIFGTRPEAVKMAPLVNALRADARFRCTVCVTAQHRELLDRVLTLFSITPDYDLNIMRERQTLADITTRVLSGLCGVIAETRPALALVHGDTTTSFAAALAAFYNRVPVGHVEAGLRTNNIYFPYPEEMNRKLTGAIAAMHFAPTEVNRQNLLREGVPDENIFVTGNTALDALKTTARGDYRFEREALNAVDFKKYRVLTVEAHRTENLGAPLQEILRALRHILEIYPDMYVVYSVHPNPAVKEPVRQALSGHPRVLLQEPFDLADYHNLIMRSFLALSDSGGIQEESPSLGTPVLVLRGETERPEAVKAGIVRLVGTSFDRVVEGVRALADDADAYRAMKGAANPYGDGHASARIIEAIAERLTQRSEPAG